MLVIEYDFLKTMFSKNLNNQRIRLDFFSHERKFKKRNTKNIHRIFKLIKGI